MVGSCFSGSERGGAALVGLLITKTSAQGTPSWSEVYLVDSRENSKLDVQVGTSAFEFEVMDERRKMLLGGAETIAGGRQELHAQMPGKIVKVLVKVGQEVERDQGLVVIEAMKMENELRSPIDGVITEIGVQEGDCASIRPQSDRNTASPNVTVFFMSDSSFWS